jgi:hypothetical protein
MLGGCAVFEREEGIEQFLDPTRTSDGQVKHRLSSVVIPSQFICYYLVNSVNILAVRQVKQGIEA